MQVCGRDHSAGHSVKSWFFTKQYLDCACVVNVGNQPGLHLELVCLVGIVKQYRGEHKQVFSVRS